MIFEYYFSSLSENADKNTEFDKLFVNRWNKLQQTPGVFRYTLSIRDEIVLPGRYGFILQLNRDRLTKRRLPDEIMSLKQSFNPTQFNFNKISENEHMFQMKLTNSTETSRDMIIINTSPICLGHSLFCPNIEDCLPQVITRRSFELLLHIAFLSSNRNLRMGFNSLCAMASVNHLHYHLLIFERRLPVETLECTHFSGPVYTLHEDYPAKGFCFQIRSKDQIAQVSSDVYKLTSYLTDKNIGHNVYVMQGKALVGSGSDVWRIFVWARENSVGTKEISSFNLAVCEFSGHFIIQDKEVINEMSEEKINEMMHGITDPVYKSIREDVLKLYM